MLFGIQEVTFFFIASWSKAHLIGVVLVSAPRRFPSVFGNDLVGGEEPIGGHELPVSNLETPGWRV